VHPIIKPIDITYNIPPDHPLSLPHEGQFPCLMSPPGPLSARGEHPKLPWNHRNHK